MQQNQLKRLPQAPKRDIKSIKNWHFNHDYAAIAREEQTYLDKHDLIRVVQNDRTPLRRVIDSSLRLRTLSIWQYRHEDDSHHGHTHVSYYSDRRIDGFVSVMIVMIGMIMLIAPIWILQALESLVMKLVTITIFISVFLLLISFAMVSKPFEALGSTAAFVKSDNSYRSAD